MSAWEGSLQKVHIRPFRVDAVHLVKVQFGWEARVFFWITAPAQFADTYSDGASVIEGHSYWSALWALWYAYRKAREVHAKASATQEERIAKGWN